jgi:hypothetical protein
MWPGKGGQPAPRKGKPVRGTRVSFKSSQDSRPDPEQDQEENEDDDESLDVHVEIQCTHFTRLVHEEGLEPPSTWF